MESLYPLLYFGIYMFISSFFILIYDGYFDIHSSDDYYVLIILAGIVWPLSSLMFVGGILGKYVISKLVED